ncbi:MAG: hypothetical protein ACLQU3_16650 [Limisphaerales bacterium]
MPLTHAGALIRLREDGTRFFDAPKWSIMKRFFSGNIAKNELKLKYVQVFDCASTPARGKRDLHH